MLRQGLNPSPSHRYASDHRRDARTPDGQPILIRCIQPADAPRLATFHAGLSEESIRRRYFHYVSLHARIDPARLEHICRPDWTSEAVLVAVLPGKPTDRPAGAEAPQPPARDRIVGVGRLEEIPNRRAEIAVLVSDALQHHGVGSLLVQDLITLARGVGLTALIAYIAPYNEPMQHLCQRLGFILDYPTEGGPMRATLNLAEPSNA